MSDWTWEYVPDAANGRVDKVDKAAAAVQDRLP
jgi:hypothetical protein